MPEVASVAWADHPPFLGHASWGFRNQDGSVDRWILNRVSDTFFETVGLPLVAGRTFSAQEIEQRAAVALGPACPPGGMSLHGPRTSVHRPVRSRSASPVWVIGRKGL